MSERILGIYIVDPDPATLGELRPRLATADLSLVGNATSAEAALPGMATTSPDVVLLDALACTSEPSTIVRRILAVCPSACVVITAAAGASPTLFSRAVATGARGFLIKPYRPEDLFGLVREATATLRALAPTAEPSGGTVVAVYGPKGGVGSSTIAVNVAVALAARKLRVGIIDLDLQFGDVGSLLDLRSANSIVDLLGHRTLTREIVDETFVSHSSGASALLAPEDLAAIERVDAEQVLRVLRQLRAHFDFLVCDLWCNLEDLTRRVLRAADSVILVTTPELASLRNLHRVLIATRADIRLDERALIVVSRYPGKVGISAQAMAKALERPITATIPSEGVHITEAANRGLTLLDPRSRTRVGRHYERLAELVAKRAPLRTPAPVLVGAPAD